MGERQYYDVDGNEVKLHQLCKLDAGWAASRIRVMTVEIEQWKNAAKVMAALYGRNVKWDGGSWFRDNIEISLDEELPAESIEDLLQIAWKANKDGVTAALSQTTKDKKPFNRLHWKRDMIAKAKELGWVYTPIELVDAGQAYGYESPEKTRFLTLEELVQEMSQTDKGSES